LFFFSDFVDNKTLTTSFVNNYAISVTRKKNSPEHFFKTTYQRNPSKVWVMERMHVLLGLLPWQEALVLPIVPALHGTDFFVARVFL
jgi:hypothetical protein